MKQSYLKNIEFPSIDYISRKFIFVSAFLLTIGITTSIAITNIALTIGFVGLLILALSKSFKFEKNDATIGFLFLQNLLSVFGINVKNSFTNLNPIRLFLPYFILSRLSEKHKFIVNLLGLITIFTSICIMVKAFFNVEIQDLFFANHIHFYYPPVQAASLWSTSFLATGSIMMMLALLFVTLSFYYNSVFYYVSAVFSFFSLFFIQELSAILGFIIGAILIPIFVKKIKKKHLIAFYAVIVAAFFIMLSFSPVKQKMIQTFQYKKNTSILFRFTQWDAAIKAMPKQNFKTIMLGFGLNNADKAILQYKIESFKEICNKYSISCDIQLVKNHPIDNLYLQTLVDYGIIGELLLFLAFFMIIRNNLKAKPISKFATAFNKATTIAFVSFMISSVFFSAFLYIDMFYFLMYLLGLNESIKAWDSSNIINKIKLM